MALDKMGKEMSEFAILTGLEMTKHPLLAIKPIISLYFSIKP